MKYSKRVLILLLASLLGCQQLPIPGNSSSAQTVWTGFIEGETVDVSSTVGGRLVSLTPQEGDAVQLNQPLFSLDDELVQRQIDIADANVAAAGAQVSLLEAGARPEDLAQAGARLDQARAGLDAAEQGVKDAEAIRANPQTLLIMQAQAELRALAAAQQFDAAVKQAQAADVEYSFWQDQEQSAWDGADIKLPNGTVHHFDTPGRRVTYVTEQASRAGHATQEAWAGVTSAGADRDAATAALKDVKDQIANPISLDARVDQARATRDHAAANVQAAQAALQALQEGASPAQIQTARAALDQARVARASLDRDEANYRVGAPQAGTVTHLFCRVGEIVPPATPVVELSVDGDLTLRVFVPMSQLQNVKVDQSVSTWLPDLNNRMVNGTVSHIADQAEFTGRQPQTDSERNAQLVAVEIKIARPESAIKAGMPASVSFSGPPVTANSQPLVGSAQPSPVAALSGPHTLSGTLEERQTRIAAELQGQIRAIQVDRGDAVKSGDVLVSLDDADIQNALTEAGAAVRTAQANLDQVQETAQPGALALADATVDGAQADLDAARQGAVNAARAAASPQDITAQLHAWQGKVNAAQGDITRAGAVIADLQSQVLQAGNDLSKAGKMRLAVLQKQGEAAQANHQAAVVTQQESQRVLDLYRALAQNPLELLAAQHGAESQVQVAEATLKVAQAGRDVVRRGAQPEAVALAQARVKMAQVSLALVQAQARRTSISSPMAGRVVDRQMKVSETARPGAPILTLADTRQLEMTVYIPVQQMAGVCSGRAAAVTLPSLPGKTYSGKVTYIAQEAEFKPANIYNSQERSEMVFAVRINIPNLNDELKAGLPADVTLR